MVLDEPFLLHIGALNASDAMITWDFASANYTVIMKPTNNSYRVKISNSSSEAVFVEAIGTSNK